MALFKGTEERFAVLVRAESQIHLLDPVSSSSPWGDVALAPIKGDTLSIGENVLGRIVVLQRPCKVPR